MTRLSFWKLQVLLILAIVTAAFGAETISPVQAITSSAAPNEQVSVSGYHDFHLLTVNQGWLVTNNQIYWTADGGTSWRLISSSIPGLTNIVAVDFIDPDEGRVLMESSGGEDPLYNLARTHDGGLTWDNVVLSLFAPGDVNALSSAVYMQWLTSQTGWLVIKRATGINFSIGSLFRTDDGGQTWIHLTAPIGEPVTFITGQIGWMAGGAAGDELYQSLDGGVTWNSRAFVTAGGNPGQSFAYLPPKFQDNSHGLLPVMYANGNNVRMDIYLTSDGGQTWSLDSSTPLDGNIDLSVRPPIIIFDVSHFLLVIPHSTRIVEGIGKGQTSSITNLDGKSANLTRIDMASMEVGLGFYTAGDCVTQSSLVPLQSTGVKGNLSCTQTNQFLKTMDGGKTWSQVGLSTTSSADLLSTKNIINPENADQTSDLLLSPNFSYDTLIGQGVDICEIPNANQMLVWWGNSPYGAVNLYIGGSLRGCRNSLLNASLVSQLFQQGWRFIPTWVGPQAPCTSFRARISSDPAAAFIQGIAEADLAVTAALNLGLTNPDGSNTVIYYDLEAYNTADTACRNAVKYFIDGWDQELAAKGNKSGVYGSVCSSGLTDFATIPHIPDSIWLAWWNYSTYNASASVFGAPCMANTYWPNHQRIHQYTGDHDETWGDVTINVDSDVLDGILSVPYQGASNLAPSQPVNPKPINGSTLLRVSDAWLYWSTNGTSCTVHLFGGALDSTSSSNCSSLHLGQLAPGAYSWQVRATNAFGTTDGPVWGFGVRPYAPTSLTLGAVKSTQVDLSWKISSDDPANVDVYDVFVNNTYIGSVAKGTSGMAIAGLVCNTPYTFFLRANRQNVQSGNSNAVSTTTGNCVTGTPGTVSPTKSPTPTSTFSGLAKISPADHSDGVTAPVTLTWGNIFDVSYYLYCYDTSDNLNCDRFWVTTNSTSATIAGLTPGLTYYWEVVAVKSSGAGFLDDGVWWSFSLEGSPQTSTPVPSSTITQTLIPTATRTPTPTRTSIAPSPSPTPTATNTASGSTFNKVEPANNKSGLPTVATLNWDNVAGVNYYIYCADKINNNTCDTSWMISYSNSAMISGLTPGNTYFWQVVAIKPNGAVFANSGLWWSFQVSGTSTIQPTSSLTATLTPTSTPTYSGTLTATSSTTPFSPTATIGGTPGSFTKALPVSESTGIPTSLAMSWGSLDGVSYYLYCYDMVNNGYCDSYWIPTTFTSVTINNLNPGSTYSWQVVAIKPSGAVFANGGDWWTFIVAR